MFLHTMFVAFLNWKDVKFWPMHLHYRNLIVSLSETWLTDSIPSTALLLPDFNFYREHIPAKSTNHSIKSKDCTSHGGVLIGVKKGIASRQSKLFDNHKSDCVCTGIDVNSKSFLVVCIYCPPENSPYRWTIDRFLSLMDEIKTLYPL